MIPLLILFTLKRLGIISVTAHLERKIKNSFMFLMLSILLLVFIDGNAINPSKGFGGLSETREIFDVHRKNKRIGTLEIKKVAFDNKVTYELTSKIDTRLLVGISVVGEERSVFENGLLVYSSVFRKINNKIKTNKQLEYKQGVYVLNKSEENSRLPLDSIRMNLVSLYFDEPGNVTEVYSDNNSQMVRIDRIGEGVYKVGISSEKYNIFHYKNRKCVRVEAVSSMYNVDLIPRKNGNGI